MGWKRNQGGKLRNEESVIQCELERARLCTYLCPGRSFTSPLLYFGFGSSCALGAISPSLPIYWIPAIGHNSHASPFLELFISHNRMDFPFIVLLSIYFCVSFCTDCMLSSITFVCIYFISLQTGIFKVILVYLTENMASSPVNSVKI